MAVKIRNYFDLKDRVMQQVYSIWFMRRMLPLVLVEAVFLGVAVRLADLYVSFGNVLGNFTDMPNIFAAGKFVLRAVLDTEFATGVVVLGGVALGMLFLRHTLRSTQFLLRRFSIVSR